MPALRLSRAHGGGVIWEVCCPVPSVLDRVHVFPQQVPPEIPIEVPPDNVLVVPVILGVVVFDQEGRTLHSVVVGAPAFLAAGPCKANITEATVIDPAPSLRRYVCRHYSGVRLQQTAQQGLLHGGHLRRRESGGCGRLYRKCISAQNAVGSNAADHGLRTLACVQRLQ